MRTFSLFQEAFLDYLNRRTKIKLRCRCFVNFFCGDAVFVIFFLRCCGVDSPPMSPSIAEVKGLAKNIETSFMRTVRSLGTVESFCLRTQQQWENEMVFFLERESILQGMLTYVMLAP